MYFCKRLNSDNYINRIRWEGNACKAHNYDGLHIWNPATDNWINCEGFQNPVTNSGNAPVPANSTGGYLGVRFQIKMSQVMAEASGLDKVKGAFVIIALKNSPAEQAGIKSGDIILAFDGENINEASAMPPIIAKTPIGKTVDVVIFRNGKEQTVKVKIGKVDDK